MRRSARTRLFAVAALTAGVGSAPGLAHAFPPYRSTDAGTAEPYDIELRLGLGKIERNAGRTEVLSPLLRTNFGLPGGFELISELEYSPRGDAFSDGAVGGKWARTLTKTFSIGVETLALVPVNRASSGAGVEAQFLATVRTESFRLHFNGGGFNDPRGGASASGWRASLLAEIPHDDYRVGLELFGKDSDRGRPDVRAGVGIIYAMSQFDLRSGFHVGLTQAAPDLGVSLWLSTSFSTAR